MCTEYDEIMATKSFLPYRMGYLTEWMIEKAKEELNETEEIRSRALEEFRSLIANDTELSCWTDDAYLLQFLRVRKFNVKAALERLQQLYRVKNNFPEVYTEILDVDAIRSVIETGGTSYLPYRDENGCVIIMFKMCKWDPDVHSFPLILSTMTAMILNAVEDPATQVCGIQILMDAQDVCMKQIRAMTSPRYLQLLSYALRNTLPVRYRGIHIFNESALYRYFYNVIKIFLTEKIRKRYQFHGSNTKNLHKYIPKEILPAEYGGDNTHFNVKDWGEKEMETYYERYAALHLKGYHKR